MSRVCCPARPLAALEVHLFACEISAPLIPAWPDSEGPSRFLQKDLKRLGQLPERKKCKNAFSANVRPALEQLCEKLQGRRK
jgi:hypothetical protein